MSAPDQLDSTAERLEEESLRELIARIQSYARTGGRKLTRDELNDRPSGRHAREGGLDDEPDRHR
jgi:hypothetical protein